MPIYAYKCAECGHQLDALQKVGDPPKIDCPQCGRPALVKQVTAAGFQLKGTGWYVTDFRDKAAAKKDKEVAPATEAGAPTPPAGAGAADAAPPAKADKAADAPAPASSPPPPPAAGSGGST
jgi:putative FmdB family regulatory protein